MRINELSVENVRSFRDKTSIKFDEAITIIIGPNGGGKTNLLDALYFALKKISSRHVTHKSAVVETMH